LDAAEDHHLRRGEGKGDVFVPRYWAGEERVWINSELAPAVAVVGVRGLSVTAGEKPHLVVIDRVAVRTLPAEESLRSHLFEERSRMGGAGRGWVVWRLNGSNPRGRDRGTPDASWRPTEAVEQIRVPGAPRRQGSVAVPAEEPQVRIHAAAADE